MIHRPRIKSKYHVETVPGEGFFLLSENERHLLQGDHLAAILPLLDGQRTWDEIRILVEPAIGRDAALAAFDVLLRHHHVEEGTGALPAEMQAFWSELNLSGPAAQKIMGEANVHILPLGSVAPAAFAQSLQSFGITIDARAPASFGVILTDDYQRPEIAATNSNCLEHGLPWLLMKPGGLIPMVGPLFVPGKTGCWKCLEQRLRHNREIETFLEHRRGRLAPLPTTRMQVPTAELPSVSLATLQIVRWLATGQCPALESKVIALDVLNARQATHLLVRRPQCEACGDRKWGKVSGRPITLRSRTLTADSGNGVRTESPERTFERYAHHISEYTGLVRSVEPSPWNDVGPLKIFSAGHNLALRTNQLSYLVDGLRATSGGKGKSTAQAKTSALCEALERCSGLFRGEEECRTASYRELGDRALDPRSVSLYSSAQYANRTTWNATCSRFHTVPLPFVESAQISWTPLWSVTEKRRKYLPTSQLYYRFEEAPEKFFCWADSNGNAAGTCLEDAILQGFLELVERDSVAIWWYNRVNRPAVDLDQLKDDYIHALQEFYARHHRRFWVLDLTSDLGIPTFAAISQRTRGSTEDIILGFGSHLDPRIGISRALTEMNQFMPSVLATDHRGKTTYGCQDPVVLDWWRNARLRTHRYLAPAKGRPRPITSPSALTSHDVKAQLQDCFARVEKLGHEVLVLDQTRPDIGLPVVKVVVPGLRHFWARFGPGRLYQVPVKLGWRKKPLAEHELNPTPLFI